MIISGPFLRRSICRFWLEPESRSWAVSPKGSAQVLQTSKICPANEYEPLSDLGKNIFAYARWIGKEQHVFIALNFNNSKHRVTLPHAGSILCATHPIDYPDISEDGSVELRPYEGVLVECSKHRLSAK